MKKKIIKNTWNAKLKRFIESPLPVENGRYGKCNYKKCNAACCRLPIRCPFLKKDLSCAIYKIRPLNCRKFPRTKNDWMLVKNDCGFKFNKI